MTSFPPRHYWIPTTAITMAASADGGPTAPEPHLDVRCHRRLRGPFTAGGQLLHAVVPDLLEDDAELLAAHASEVVALAPDLASLVPTRPRTLTNLAESTERTRFYPASRALRIAHGIVELLIEWARIRHPGGAVVVFRDVDDADPADRDLVAVFLRRCDPARLTVVVESRNAAPTDSVNGSGDMLKRMLSSHTLRATARSTTPQKPALDVDPAQLYIDSEGTSRDRALIDAYFALPPQERARRHSARAERLAADSEPTLRYGAIPYHLEHGTDPAGAGAAALVAAAEGCFAAGFYHAVVDFAVRARRLAPDAERPAWYWNITHKIGACLSYLGDGEDAIGYLAEIRRGSTDPGLHMNGSYQLAMLYTRFLPKELHDEDRALESVNTAIAIADQQPDPRRRPLVRAFMRNARALVELHRGNPARALSLVNEAIELTDTGFEPGEQLLHRSVLLYNRAQVLAAGGNHTESLLDYDLLIERDPDYGDYYFERAAVRRALGMPTEALEDYAAAIRLTPPFHEAHFNRAELLRDLGRNDEALLDLDYALELEPDHVDTLLNHADLLLGLGQTQRARADVDRGLTLQPRNAHLLSVQGDIFAEDGDTDGAYASYTDALAADPHFAAAWANRAVLSYTAGRLQDAVDDLDRAIGLADDPMLRANRAIALQDLGEHRRALDDLDIAVVTLGGLDPDLLYRRGASRYELGDTDGARADWRAHLAAYAPAESSPYAERIKAWTADLAVGSGAPGNAT
jgi:tetratricopeptide (TPR) repeat protein